MTRNEVNEYADTLDEQIIVFDNPNFDNSIIGISYDNRVIYDYQLMVQDLMQQDNIEEEDAIDFIDYNTLRSLDYIDNGPIILFIKGIE